MRGAVAILVMATCGAAAAGQGRPVPKPFPEPAAQPARPAVAPADPRRQHQQAPSTADAGETPTEAALGLPIYPAGQYLASYDAGRNQRYYLFGTNTSFVDLVTYYRNVLNTRGNLVFEQPPVHMFEVGRFREETMAFPPGVTIKDYTWGGSAGYLHPKTGERYRTVIQIVPAPR
jgi:hypothetical protein